MTGDEILKTMPARPFDDIAWGNINNAAMEAWEEFRERENLVDQELEIRIRLAIIPVMLDALQVIGVTKDVLFDEMLARNQGPWTMVASAYYYLASKQLALPNDREILDIAARKALSEPSTVH